MKTFNTMKQMETELKKVSSITELAQDIRFTSQGTTSTLRFVGLGSAAGQTEAAWVADENSDNLRVEYSGERDAITVTKVKTNKY